MLAYSNCVQESPL